MSTMSPTTTPAASRQTRLAIADHEGMSADIWRSLAKADSAPAS